MTYNYPKSLIESNMTINYTHNAGFESQIMITYTCRRFTNPQ